MTFFGPKTNSFEKFSPRASFWGMICLILADDPKWPQIWNLTPKQKRVLWLEIMFRSYWSFWAIVSENWSNLWFWRNDTNVNRKQAIKPEVGRILKKLVVQSCVWRRGLRVQSFQKFGRKIVQLSGSGLLKQGCKTWAFEIAVRKEWEASSKLRDSNNLKIASA